MHLPRCRIQPDRARSAYGAIEPEIPLACTAAVERIDEIAAVPGIDLLAVGPSDLSRSLGVAGEPDHVSLVAAIDRVRAAAAKSAGARLALTMHHAALRSMRAQCDEARRLLA